MDASGVAIGVMCTVVVLCLAFWLTAVMLAARQPWSSRVRSEKMPTGVHGGRHVAVGGRSVGPTRTAPVAAAASGALPATAGDAAPAGGAVIVNDGVSAVATDGGVGAVATDGTAAVPRPRPDQARAAEPVAAAERPAGIPGPRADQDQQVSQD